MTPRLATTLKDALSAASSSVRAPTLAAWLGGAVTLGALATPAQAAPAPPAAEVPGVFVLGIDGVDPVVLQKYMDAGLMPNFQALAATGTFQQLGTSNPPQSPVAWSNFVTGMDPGGHGIYDFVHRDPRTYGPISSATAPTSGDEPIILSMFGLELPVAGGDEIVNNRSGTPFWDLLHDAGVPVEVYRMPGNFPPTPSEARTLAGMGTDDLRALNGKYFWYTDEILFGKSDLKAELQEVSRDDDDGDGFAETIRTELKGPLDALRSDPPTEYIELPMTVTIAPDEGSVWIEVGDAQTIVDVGAWSEWVDVSFDAMPMGMAPLGGIVRFYVKQVSPDFKMYVSPINFSPAAPVTPIATPDSFTDELFERLGNFYTQGMPEEVNALKDGFFEVSDFISQVQQVHADGHEMLAMALERFDPGDCTFMYLSDIDLQCHMLWHTGDPKHDGAPRHPAWTERDAAQGEGWIQRFYEGIDEALGRVRQALPDDTVLIVMSDHGFQPYTRKVHLNDWLLQEGYLKLTGDKTNGHLGLVRDPESGLVDWELTSIDWRETKAYGVGFNGIYLNRVGREAEGIVTDAEAEALIAEIKGKLAAFIDPDTGARIVKQAYASDEVYQEARRAEAPDVIVGYAAPYGASEKTTLGEVTGETIVYDNLGHDFTGNHLMDPSEVPGILLVNRALGRDGHDLTDVTATLLRHFGVDKTDGMTGSSFLHD